MVVYPLRLSGISLPAWREYELGERLVGAALQAGGTHTAFIGPSELTVLDWDQHAAWNASDAVPLLLRGGLRPREALVLRMAVERRVQSEIQHAEDPLGRRRSASASEVTTWAARAELLHPSSEHLLAEVEAQVAVDPFAPPTGEEEFDPSPALTHLIERVAAEALALVRPFSVRRPERPSVQLSLAQTPAMTRDLALLDTQGPGAISGMDALTAQLWLENRARFLTPTLSDREVRQVARGRRGLWVRAAPETGSLRRGDVLIEVDGEAPLAEVLTRKRLSGLLIPVRIARDAVEVDALVQ